jgi:hypothetical protein
MQAHACNDTYAYSTSKILLCYPILPLAPLFPLNVNYPFNLLGNPLFGDRGANVHPHSSLVGNWLPTPCSPPSLSPPNGSPSSCYVFSETTSQYLLHSLIQVWIRGRYDDADTIDEKKQRSKILCKCIFKPAPLAAEEGKADLISKMWRGGKLSTL